jgi:hypothetical protein
MGGLGSGGRRRESGRKPVTEGSPKLSMANLSRLRQRRAERRRIRHRRPKIPNARDCAESTLATTVTAPNEGLEEGVTMPARFITVMIRYQPTTQRS